MPRIPELLINDIYAKHVYSEYIDYDTNLLKTEPSIVESYSPTNNFFKQFYNTLSDQVLPNGCKYFETLPNNSMLLVIEEEPKIRTIGFSGDFTSMLERHKRNNKFEEYGLDIYSKPSLLYNFTLSFPFVVFIIEIRSNGFKKVKVFFRLQPITSLDDYLLVPCLQNIGADYSICFGDEQESTNINLCDNVSELISSFWLKRFNNDYSSHFSMYQENPYLTDFFTWQHYTKIDPTFIFGIEWGSTNKTIRSIINVTKNNISYSLHDFNKTIQQKFKKELVEYNTDAVVIQNSLITVGDQINYDNKKYYVNKIVYDDNYYNTGQKYPNFILEDEEYNIIELKTNEFNIDKLIFEKIPIESIKVDENLILAINDIVFFKDSNSVSFIEKIHKLKDGSIHIKIGKDFYLLSNFIKNRLVKLDPENLSFQGKKLIIGESYNFIRDGSSYKNEVFKLLLKGKYTGNSVINHKIVFQFIKEDGIVFDIYANNSDFKLINDDQITTYDIFRYNDEIFSNKDNDVRIQYHFVKDYGLCFTAKTKTYLNYLTTNTDLCYNYFKNLIDSKTDTFLIKSIDKDVSYTVGDEVVVIDWKSPEEMFNIRKVVGFELDDSVNTTENNYTKYFCLLLKDDNDNILKFPVVTFNYQYDGKVKNYFAQVRKVSRTAEQYKTNMIVKANQKGICDFPMKDYNQIKAFIIDDTEILVLFSNYRTLTYETLVNKFNIVADHYINMVVVDKNNLNIKPQEGDIFIRKYDQTLVMSLKPISHMYTITPSDYDYSRISSRRDNELIRYGLLQPRYTAPELNEMTPKSIIFNDYGNGIYLNGVGRPFRTKRRIYEHTCI